MKLSFNIQIVSQYIRNVLVGDYWTILLWVWCTDGLYKGRFQFVANISRIWKNFNPHSQTRRMKSVLHKNNNTNIISLNKQITNLQAISELKVHGTTGVVQTLFKKFHGTLEKVPWNFLIKISFNEHLKDIWNYILIRNESCRKCILYNANIDNKT